VGLLGPKQRLEDLVADIEGLGIAVSADQRGRLHGPAGLDIGGEGPEAIALSLLAEVMAVAEGRSGGWLRDRKAPIHEPEGA
jgi:xanthine dehydrogenase accessory factor